MSRALRVTLTLSILSCAGCATSQVVTNDPAAAIWANGRLIGHGQGELDHLGMPEKTLVQVRTTDGRGRDLVVKRHVTGFTTLAGILTYGICFLFCWEYPETIVAFLPPPPPAPPSPLAAAPTPPAASPSAPAAASPPSPP
jgi:hypothetical protein